MESSSIQFESINDIIMFSRGVKKHIMKFTIRELSILVANGSIVIAPFNRDEVKAREGTADELFLSMASKLSIGTLLAYWDGIVPSSNKFVPTPSAPIKITEGGHRTRWLTKIMNGTALLFGKPLADLESTHPDLYRAIMDYEVVFNIATHESGVVPESFMKFEYTRINTFTSTLKPGEILRASENAAHMGLVERFKENVIFKHKFTDSRDSATTTAAAFVNGLLFGVDGITTKAKDILELAKTVPTQEQIAGANKLIDCYVNLEREVLSKYPEIDEPADASKEAKKRIRAANKVNAGFRQRFSMRGVNTAFDGVLIAALIRARNASEITAVCEDIKNFYEISLQNNDVWKSNRGQVEQPGPNNPARYYSPRRFEHGWGQLQAIINPQAVRVDPASGGCGQSV